MKASTVIEVLSAAHLTQYVDRNVFQQRGGIFLIAPPGSLKSTFVNNSLKCYPDALRLPDLNVQTLGYIKNGFIEGKYSTLAFGEFEKLYQRNPATAANIEGHLKAMVEEGFGKQSFEDQRAVSFETRMLMIGGVTPTCHSKLITRWMENGFHRRFLWCAYQLENPEVIADAIEKWKALNLGKSSREIPNNNVIPMSITAGESKAIRNLLGIQAKETPFVLMKKIFCVLKWRHKARKAMNILEDFSEGLGERAAKLII